jgi:hypothetical protein
MELSFIYIPLWMFIARWFSHSDHISVTMLYIKNWLIHLFTPIFKIFLKF